MLPLSTCLWFDTQAEEAAEYYVSIFPDSRIVDKTYYTKGLHKPEGTVLTVRFVLNGREFVALNGGPNFQFTMAISIVASCDTQAEVDRLWERFCEGGAPGQCGWLTDRYGLSWQIVPAAFLQMLTGPDRAAVQRGMDAMLQMTKLDLPTLQRAYEGAFA